MQRRHKLKEMERKQFAGAKRDGAAWDSRQIIMKGMCIACAVLLGLTGFLALPADYSILSRAEDELESRYAALSEEDLEEQLAQAEDAAQAQALILQTLQEQVLALNQEMLDLSVQIAAIGAEITAKEAELAAAQEELAAAQELRQEQYDSMKLRIQYMYENQDSGLLAASMGGGSINELLAAVEYVTQIAGYDREKLKEYRDIQEEIAQREETLQVQQSELETLEAELQEKQIQTSEYIAVVQANVAACTAALAQYQTDMSRLTDQIALRDALLVQLEESMSVAESESAAASVRASEEAAYEASVRESVEASIEASIEASLAAARETGRSEEPEETEPAEESGASGYPGETGSASELDMLAAIIYCEAQGEGYEGKVGVGNVVLNRMASESFPNTMLEVLYQTNQFAPVFSGSYAVALAFGMADEACYEAARDALNGVNTVGACLYFRRASGEETGGLTIGNIYFY